MKQQRVFKLALLGLSDHERRVIQSVINNLGTRERAYWVLEKKRCVVSGYRVAR
jgi:hypothetical protein